MQPPRSEQPVADSPQDEMPQQGEMPPQEVPSLEQLAQAYQQHQECLDTLRRTQADFINYKRRALHEQAEARTAAQGELLETLLPVLDDLGRALEATPAELSDRPWVQGLHLVARRLGQILQQMGVEQVGLPGEVFDPYWHEAVLTQPCSDMPEGTIVHVARPGYTLGERVLRPAQVVVAAPEVTVEAPSEG
jgi:molecular chaperone GrpE